MGPRSRPGEHDGLHQPDHDGSYSEAISDIQNLQVMGKPESDGGVLIEEVSGMTEARL